jgi:uncharacterized membrane protein YdjX (TVP38/TMEM64 family)
MSFYSRYKPMIKALAMVAILVALGLTVKLTHLEDMLSSEWIDSEIRGHGLTGILIFVGVGVLFTALGLPRQVVAFFGGYAYGFLPGAGLALTATISGCMGTFFYARFFGREFVARRHGGKIARVDRFLGRHPFHMTLMVRFMPLGSNVLTNLAAGVSSVKALPFLAGSLIGFIPQTAIFALLGSGFKVQPEWRITVAVILLLISTAIGIVIYRRNKEAVLDKNDPE